MYFTLSYQNFIPAPNVTSVLSRLGVFARLNMNKSFPVFKNLVSALIYEFEVGSNSRANAMPDALSPVRSPSLFEYNPERIPLLSS